MTPVQDAVRRLVLDTNVILDLVVFDDPGVAPIRAAVEAGTVTLFTCPACLAELRRVLAYPELGLAATAQDAAYDWYAARAQCTEISATPSLPRCRDADDQKFLELAWSTGADRLVTKDKALLELARRVATLGRFSVTRPTDPALASQWARSQGVA